jgi:3-oxoacyl-[acyl-carrier-protein] synthase II
LSIVDLTQSETLSKIQNPEPDQSGSVKLSKAEVSKSRAERRRSIQNSRVVVTGIGAITALGHSVVETWDNLLKGKSGIDTITLCDHSRLPVHIAGEVKEFEATRYIPRKEARRMARASHFAIAAAQQAVEDANLSYPFIDDLAERSGVMLGTTMGGFDKAEQGIREYLQGLNKVSPFSLATSSPNLSTFHVCVKLNAQGYTNTISTACSAGTVALAEAAEVIKRGRCDIMIAGGTEANINEITLVGFIALRALSTRNDEPNQASRPFDATRDGFILGEGSASPFLFWSDWSMLWSVGFAFMPKSWAMPTPPTLTTLPFLIRKAEVQFGP